MSLLSKRERILATIQGKETDRVPVSAWGHLLPAEKTIEGLAEATLHFTSEYDWDWIKVNPRATYFAEAWGNRYDFEDYAGVLPKLVSSPLGEKPDLTQIQPVSATEGSFGDHLRLVNLIKKGASGIPFVQTVFTPLSVLGFLLARNTVHTQEAIIDAQLEVVKRAVKEQPHAVHAALEAITETLARYASEVLNAGADGIFLAITGLAREGVLSLEEYEEFGKPYDRKVLAAAGGAEFNIFHICGDESYLKAIADLPVAAVSWAAVGHRNPDLAEARKFLNQALIGGVDEKHLLLNGRPDEVAAQAENAIALGGRSKFFLAPGCSIDPATPTENLKALRRSVNNR